MLNFKKVKTNAHYFFYNSPPLLDTLVPIVLELGRSMTYLSVKKKSFNLIINDAN